MEQSPLSNSLLALVACHPVPGLAQIRREGLARCENDGDLASVPLGSCDLAGPEHCQAENRHVQAVDVFRWADVLLYQYGHGHNWQIVAHAPAQTPATAFHR